eukprot:6483547-Amphidinium_carterae.1
MSAGRDRQALAAAQRRLAFDGATVMYITCMSQEGCADAAAPLTGESRQGSRSSGSSSLANAPRLVLDSSGCLIEEVLLVTKLLGRTN